jgi:hypothetical protein
VFWFCYDNSREYEIIQISSAVKVEETLRDDGYAWMVLVLTKTLPQHGWRWVWENEFVDREEAIDWAIKFSQESA